MTQRDPDPASLPEAIPVLSYERQTDDGAMDWVVRFIGAWVICNGTASASPQVVSLWRQGLMAVFNLRYAYQLYPLASLFCSLALIGFGIAITRRYRYGFYGSLIAIAVGVIPELIFRFSTAPGRTALLLLPSSILPTTALFAVLLSVLRRADAKGVLQPIPPNRSDTLKDGDSIGFLISRLGWLYLAWGGRVIVDLAMLPLRAWAGMTTTSIWSWPTGVYIALYLAVGMGGLLLHRRKVWALGLLASILPIHVISQFIIRWSYSPAMANLIPWLLSLYLSPVLETAASVFMLCLLARKAERTGM